MPTADLYAALGVARDADEATIRRAYRRAAKRAHPDGGGTTEAFTRLSKALKVLTDPKARKQYDTTGEADEPGPDQQPSQILVAAAQAIFTVMQQVDNVDTNDLIALAQQFLRTQNGGCRAAIANIKMVIAKIEKVELRLRRRKGGKDDPIRGMLIGQIQMFRRTIEMNEQNIRTNDEATKILADYVYNYVRPTQPSWAPPFPFLGQHRDDNRW